MNLKEYQEFCKKGLRKGNNSNVFALGLGGETGEVLEVIKKSLRDEKPIDLSHLKEELGDVMWYVANLCSSYDLSLQNIIDENVDKLSKRYSKEIREEEQINVDSN